MKVDRRAGSTRAAFTIALLATAGVVFGPTSAAAQIVVACDFDIVDDKGAHTFGQTSHLVGRAGAGTNRGSFFLTNGDTPAGDSDLDGYGPGCDFNNLFVAFKTNLINLDNPALAIPAENIIVTNFPRVLLSGQSAEVVVFVEVPAGTVAGTYEGRIVVRDNRIFSRVSPSGDVLNLDRHLISVRVLEQPDFTIVDPDSAAELDSVVVRGRAGQRATGVFRLANSGNAPFRDVRISATDLRSESAIGLTIPSDRVEFTPPDLSALAVGDTARITVTVDIPRGILGGRYRGAILVQGEGVPTEQIPLIVIVTSSRGILFANNPVRSSLGDVGRFAFNGDPGTTYKVGIFTMAGLLVWTDQGTVFAGVSNGGGGTAENPGAGADFAVNYLWPLRNGRGEEVASGMYLVVVESIVNGQRQQAKDRLMVIR